MKHEGVIEYERYRLSFREGLLYLLEYLLMTSLTAYLFYDSVYAFFVFLGGFVWFIRKKKRQLIQKRKKELSRQFQEAIEAAATALAAGFSVENAFLESQKDMQKLYGTDSMIVRELQGLMQYLSVGKTLESFLLEFGERSGIEDIRDFGIVFSAAKRNGGNFNQIIRKCVTIMHEKQETEYEIAVLLSGKNFEQKILSVIPFAIIGYLRCSTKGFLDILYHNPAGITVMSLCFAIYAAAYLLAEKIAAIEV
ncbi:MAG TPA: pilus assembly protein TadB [Lachnospiraceae bacterium]|nr:pilus assembly protein TadB [Lachnospiraceae bacterium]